MNDFPHERFGKSCLTLVTHLIPVDDTVLAFCSIGTIFTVELIFVVVVFKFLKREREIKWGRGESNFQRGVS